MTTWPALWADQTLHLWRKLALDELLGYLEMRLNEHNFEFLFGNKTKEIFLRLLCDFSIYEIYNFIWGSVTAAVAYQVRTRISGRQAANSVIGNCQQRAERALAEGWAVKAYRRDPKLPISARSNLFSNVVTKLGDRFYSEAPNVESISKTIYT